MNEHGSFTIVGLCLLLVAAIFIKGVHEFEANYARGITNFQAEHELQNFADSYLVEASKNLPSLTEWQPYNILNTTVHSKKFGIIKIEVRAQKQPIKKFIRIYSNSDINSPYTDNDAGESPQSATVIVVVANCNSPFIAGKMYRRAFAYILDDDESKTIHFVNSL